MFGTVGRARVKPENREKLAETLKGQSYAEVPGFRQAWLMFPENREDEAIMVVFFEDRESYFKNAEDPAQHERWLEYSQYFEGDPQWSDGEWIEPSAGS